tara:strand:+ start:1052 stop:2032 length:981 start_codon:yes stop_codon:yes gene_type:complete
MLIKNILKIIIASVIIYFLISHNSLNFSTIFDLDLVLVIKVVLLCFIIMILGALKWFLLLNIQNKKISFIRTLESYYLGYALNYYLFGVAGDIIKTLYISKNNENKTGITLSVILDRVIGLICMGIIILYSIPVILISLEISEIYIKNNKDIYFYYFLLSFLIVFLILLIKKILNSVRIKNFTINSSKKYKNKIIKTIFNIIDVFFMYKNNYQNIIFNIIFSISIQIIIAFSLYIISTKTLIVDLGLISHTISSVCVQILGIIPISPGNIGVGEAAFSQIMYYMSGYKVLEFASVYFIYRLINMVFALPGMFVYFFSIKRGLNSGK